MKGALVTVAGICAFVAVSAPWLAPRVAAVLLAFVVAAYFALRLRDVTSIARVADERRFVTTERARRTLPSDMQVLDAELRRSRMGRSLTPVVKDCLGRLAASRLRDRHGLEVRDPSMHHRIRAILTPELFEMATRTAAASPPSAPSTPTRVSPRMLPSLIAEVERL